MHAIRAALAAMALAALPVLAQADPASDLRASIQELSGHALSAAVTVAFAPDAGERYQAVFYAPYSELWLMDAKAASMLDTGFVTLDPQQHGADVVVDWTGSGRTSRLPVSVLLELVRNEAPGPEQVALARCRDRVRQGGVLGRDVGPFSAGQRIVGGTIISGTAAIGQVSGDGGRISLIAGPVKSVVECSELISALGEADLPAEQLAGELASAAPDAGGRQCRDEAAVGLPVAAQESCDQRSGCRPERTA